MKARFVTASIALTIAAALGSLQATASATSPTGIVLGGGKAVVTDPDGVKSSVEFAIAAVVKDDGSVNGFATFLFRKPFARDWGAVPGVVDLIWLGAEINAGAVADNGAITLNGEFIEVDISHDEGIVFVEKDTELTSLFEIVVGGDLPPKNFTLQWCLLPTFNMEVTRGHLRVR